MDTTTSKTNRADAAPQRITVREGKRNGKQLIVIKSTEGGNVTVITKRLINILSSSDRYGSSMFYVHFQQTPDEIFQKKIVDGIQEALRADSDEEAVVSVEESSWYGPRLQVPESSDPHFRLLLPDDIWYCGFWLEPTLLVIGALDPYNPLDGICAINIKHWHPDSRTSGSWEDGYALLDEQLEMHWNLRDEDGAFVTFQRVEAKTPKQMADLMCDAASRCDLSEIVNPRVLLQAFFLGFNGGIVAMLRNTENPGYEIAKLSVSAPDAVLAHLRELNKTDRDDAAEWLSAIRNNVSDNFWHECLNGYATDFLQRLASLAGVDLISVERCLK